MNGYKVFAWCLAFWILGAAAQALADQPNLETGVPSDSSSNGGSIDSVDMQTGRLLLGVPLPILSPQRSGKLNFEFALGANSFPWSVKYAQGAVPSPTSCRPGTTNCTWSTVIGDLPPIGNLTSGVGLVRGWDITYHQNVREGGGNPIVNFNRYLITADGSIHHLQDISSDHTQYVSIDGSGYRVQLTYDSSGFVASGQIIFRSGSVATLVFQPRVNCVDLGSLGRTVQCDQYTVTSKVTDVHGNVYTLIGANGGAGEDTMGRTPPTEVVAGPANTAACYSRAGLPISSTATIGYLGYGGSVQTITECYASYSLQTAFNQSGVNEANITKPLMVTAVMPDGLKYSFDYDSYGNLIYVGLPQGGSIGYSWQSINLGLPNCGNAAKLSRAVQTRTLNDNNGHSYAWNYSYGGLQSDGTLTNTVTDPNGNDTDAVFSTYANSNAGGIATASACLGLIQTGTRVYAGTGPSRTLLAQTDTTYQAALLPEEPATSTAGGNVGNVYATTITTTDAVAGKVKQVVRTPDTGLGNGQPFFGETVAEKVYDWGSGSPGALLKETDTQYLWQVSSCYGLTGSDVLDIPAAVIVKDGSGIQMGKTNYAYDIDAQHVIASGISLQKVPGAACAGNLNQITQYTDNTGGNFTQSGFIDYDTGLVFKATNPNGNTTVYKYDSTGSYVVETDLPSTTNTVVPGEPTVTHVTKAGHDFNSGLVTTATDENNNVTSINYSAADNRVSSTSYPDGGSTSYGYFNNFTSVEKDNKIDANSHTAYSYQVDGLGRPYAQHRLTGGGYVNVDTTYDAFGRIVSVSNPHYSTSGSTDGLTQNRYDALGRVVEVIEADESVLQKSYSQTTAGADGVCTVSSDEHFRSREICTDALGRLTTVIEDPILASNPDAGGLNIETDYAYSTAPNGYSQVTVTQKGEPGTAQSQWRMHTATYDGLNRLLSATNPETGTTAYTYDNVGNVITRTDNRNITATYTLDQLNRILLVAFNDGKTQNAFYLYDYAQTGSVTTANPKGRLVAVSTGGNRWFIYNYDTMGRINALYQCSGDSNGSPVNCAVNTASYDLVGDMTALTTLNGFSVNYTYDQSGWVQSAKNADGTVYVSAVTYAPNGSTTSIVTPNFNYNFVYNNRFQPTQIAIGSLTQSLMVKDYNYGLGNDNGDVLETTDEMDDSRSLSFNYDTLNRLESANSGSATNATCKQLRHSDFQCTPGEDVWAETFSYDDWGNLTGKTNVGGAGEQVSMTVDVSNRISQYVNQTGSAMTPSYDPTGNMTADGINTYTFDGWNRMTAAGSTSYIYGPGGERWSKSINGGVPFLYFYGVNGRLVADQSGNNVTNYVYLGSTRLARVNGNTVNYYLMDAFGSTNKLVDQSGRLLDDQEFFPYGGTVPGVGGVKSSNYFEFTGQPRDTETGLDFFGARYYNSMLGRFVSADWSGAPAATPYANPAAPQSYNLYSYVENNPTSNRDLNGHQAAFVKEVFDSGEGYCLDCAIFTDDSAVGNEEDIEGDGAQQSAPSSTNTQSDAGGTDPAPNLSVIGANSDTEMMAKIASILGSFKGSPVTNDPWYVADDGKYEMLRTVQATIYNGNVNEWGGSGIEASDGSIIPLQATPGPECNDHNCHMSLQAGLDPAVTSTMRRVAYEWHTHPAGGSQPPSIDGEDKGDWAAALPSPSQNFVFGIGNRTVYNYEGQADGWKGVHLIGTMSFRDFFRGVPNNPF